MTTASTIPNETTTPLQPPSPAPDAPAQAAPTTTAVATSTPSPVRAPDTAEGTVDAFASMAKFRTAQEIAKHLATSTLVPPDYRNNPANCLIAIELASRIGASVFAVIQNIDIIHGRPSWRATFLIATVNACGRFTPLRFRWQGEEGKPSWGCRAVAKDRESGEECLGALITIALATAEGWATKSGSKWRTMPEQMLMYRAAAFWTRVYAPDLSLGMRTSDEEEDVGPAYEVKRDLEVGALGAAIQRKDLEEQLRARSGVSATTVQAEIEEPGPAPAAPTANVEVKPAAAPEPAPTKGKRGQPKDQATLDLEAEQQAAERALGGQRQAGED